MSARKVCKTWRQICSDPEMWRVIKIKHSDYEKSPKILKHVVMKAVDLSCGQLVHLDLQIWGHPRNLLRYVFDRHTKMGCDEDGLAIAEHMTGLRHLELCGPNKMTSDGLLAILENCPHLESLHVRLGVPEVGLDLVRRLSQQIKDLKLSYDCMGDSDSSDSDFSDFSDQGCEISNFYADDETDDLDLVSSDKDDFSDYDDYEDNDSDTDSE